MGRWTRLKTAAFVGLRQHMPGSVFQIAPGGIASAATHPPNLPIPPPAKAGYSHNYNPDNFLRAEERCGVMLTVQAKLMPAWTDYVRSLHSVFEAYDNFMFAFTSWEVRCVAGPCVQA